MPNTHDLTRREVIRRALLIAGATTFVTNATLTSAFAQETTRANAASDTTFTEAEIAWLDEVAETILPETETPGAKAAEVGAFIALMVTDTFSPDEQTNFANGVSMLESTCVAEFGTGFMETAQASRLALLERLDQERVDQDGHYFSAIKELTVLGYFTSEIGYTQALRYIETPGRYDGCVDYQSGERSWARHA